MDWSEEVEMIDGRRNHVALRMTMSSQCTCNVNPVHQPSTEQRAQRICIVWQNDLCHLRLRLAHRTRVQTYCSVTHRSRPFVIPKAQLRNPCPLHVGSSTPSKTLPPASAPVHSDA